MASMRGSSARKNRKQCRTATLTLQEKGADLIDDARAPAQKPLAHTVRLRRSQSVVLLQAWCAPRLGVSS